MKGTTVLLKTLFNDSIKFGHSFQAPKRGIWEWLNVVWNKLEFKIAILLPSLEISFSFYLFL